MENDITLWETDYWFVYLARDQTYLGRSVVVLKRRPCASLSELREDELLDLKNNVMLPFEAAVKKTFGAELFNWACLMNLAYQNTPPDPHMHWHVWPRYRSPVELEGEVFVDDRFGRHYLVGTERLLPIECRRLLADKILAAKV